ncbi:MAG: glycerol-3-phosphate 1-O-acyltransferase PlsY [Candidatus Delongbacteria bacterium]|nr:glycerol-3-phosphate 1-O-acyltransferase PlsY [Candidatus Delongbacteria bacterium]
MIHWLYWIFPYLIGSIPTSVWIGRLVRGIDIREHGSGNAGATNTYRVLGRNCAVVVTLIDILKGFISVYGLSHWLTPDASVDQIALWRIGAGLAAMIGHIYPIWAGFRGGKGVLTAIGAILALTPQASLLAIAIGVALLLITHIVSIGSIIGGLAYPLMIFFFFPGDSSYYLVFGIVCFLIFVYTHRSNIRRLLNHQENKIF